MDTPDRALQPYRCAAPESRRLQVWTTLGVWGGLVFTANVFIYASASAYVAVPVTIALLAPLVYLFIRAARVSVEVDERSVTVRNPYRTVALGWGEIETVVPSTYGGPYGYRLPAILITTTMGKRLRAVAVPQDQNQLPDIISAVLSFAPEHVRIRSAAASGGASA